MTFTDEFSSPVLLENIMHFKGCSLVGFPAQRWVLEIPSGIATLLSQDDCYFCLCLLFVLSVLFIHFVCSSEFTVMDSQ